MFKKPIVWMVFVKDGSHLEENSFSTRNDAREFARVERAFNTFSIREIFGPFKYEPVNA